VVLFNVCEDWLNIKAPLLSVPDPLLTVEQLMCLLFLPFKVDINLNDPVCFRLMASAV
jgi:hypothetical protein